MRFVAFALAVFSFNAFACPNLAGKYAVCRSTTGVRSGSSDTIITQSVVQGVTIFEVTATDEDTQERETTIFRADGRNYTRTETDTESGWTMQTTTNARCAGNALKISTIGVIEGQEFIRLNMDVTKNGRQMIQVVKGQMMGMPVEDRIICE
jgi:hypothetical protein